MMSWKEIFFCRLRALLADLAEVLCCESVIRVAPQPGLELCMERVVPINVVRGCHLFNELGLLRVVLFDNNA